MAAAAPKPAPRLVKTWQDAEDYAAEYVRWLGWADAHSTRRTADEGIDVLGNHRLRGKLVAQVKMEGKPVESRVVRDLRGAGTVMGAKTHVLFALAGFKEPAIDWANRAEVALFEFAFDGSVTPVNDHAKTLTLAKSRTKNNAANRTTTTPPRIAESRAALDAVLAPKSSPKPKGPTGAAASLRPDDLKVLSAVEKWEREDRRHLASSNGNGLGAGILNQHLGLPQGYLFAAHADLGRYLNYGIVHRDKFLGVIAFSISGIKPAGVKALRDWGIPVQAWRG